MNPLDKLISLYYNQTECAKALGITPQRLTNWIIKGFIPYKNGAMVEEKTNGKVKASAIYSYAGKLKKGII